jgi:hypothetical protein
MAESRAGIGFAAAESRRDNGEESSNTSAARANLPPAHLARPVVVVGASLLAKHGGSRPRPLLRARRSVPLDQRFALTNGGPGVCQ